MKKKLFLFITVVLVGILLPILIYNQSDAQIYQEGKINYSVGPGDTLWSIANEFYPQENTRKMVYQIQKLNDIQDAGSLRIGTELKLP